MYFRWYIRPKFLKDVSKRDMSTSVLGYKLNVPFGVAPTAMQRMAHPDGECANVKGMCKKRFIKNILQYFAKHNFIFGALCTIIL